MSDATTTLPNAYEIVKSAYEQTADAMTRSVEMVVGNPYVAATSGQVLNGYLALQETFRASVQATLAALQGPLGDGSELADRVAAVETALGGLAARTESLAKKVGAPSTAVIDRLVMIESRIEALRAVAERPAPAPDNGLADRLSGIEAKLDKLAKAGADAPKATAAPASKPAASTDKTTSASTEPQKAPTQPAKKPAARRMATQTKK